jgi:tRNA modification GTPase
MSTIAAIATAIAPQQGSIGIVRLSGPEAIAIAQKLFQAPGHQPWDSHRILYGQIRDPRTDLLVDEALLLLMKGPRSYTREDVVELHCHGGLIVVQQVLQLCIAQGAKLAQPGEFSLRAFLNGRIDLTQAEGIADLVSAQSPQAAHIALAGIQGKLAQPIRQLRETCLDILAEVEARLDFDDDMVPLNPAQVQRQIEAAAAQVAEILATADRGELLRSGLKVAIVGRPNVGKSSLLNAWSRSDRAIVTDLPGTTRDIVESQLVVGGIPIQVLDTAGIREASDQVERLGVERSRQAAQQADLLLFVLSALDGWTAEDELIYQDIRHYPHCIVLNKIDVLPGDVLPGDVLPGDALPGDVLSGDLLPESAGQLNLLLADIAARTNCEPRAIVQTAAALNQGIDHLEAAILRSVHQGDSTMMNLDLAINQRQASALTQAQRSLDQVLQTIADQMPLDFWTIDLRGAVQSLGEITGESLTESMLDRIFSRFCIGK